MAARRGSWVARVGAALCLLLGDVALAERQHTVREGQSLASIARGYEVSIGSLAAANERPPDAPLKVGEVLTVPQKGVIVLAAGQSLWSVARAHGCSVDALARTNRIQPGSALKPGMRLLLPGRPSPTTSAREQAAGAPARTTTASASPARTRGRPSPGTLSLYRIATSERLRLTVTDAKGRVRREAQNQLARFLRPRRSTKQKRPDARLVALLAEISHHYEGRTIQVVSGYRAPGGYTSRESRHTKGAAIDLRIDGINERALCDYLRHFRDVGVGLYPNGHFVHLDVRDKNAYWIDLSSPGRKPSYLDRDQRDHFDGKNKDEGLVELGRSVEQVLGEQTSHEEPEAADPEAADE